MHEQMNSRKWATSNCRDRPRPLLHQLEATCLKQGLNFVHVFGVFQSIIGPSTVPPRNRATVKEHLAIQHVEIDGVHHRPVPAYSDGDIPALEAWSAFADVFVARGPVFLFVLPGNPVSDWEVLNTGKKFRYVPQLSIPKDNSCVPGIIVPVYATLLERVSVVRFPSSIPVVNRENIPVPFRRLRTTVPNRDGWVEARRRLCRI